jgi:cell division protein FtsI/penicillin-binding protein 2
MKNYGLGMETGIDLPNETVGLVKNLDSSREIDMVTASYGQGVAVTPVEMVRALSVLANGGTLITPHLFKSKTIAHCLLGRLSSYGYSISRFKCQFLTLAINYTFFFM